MSDRVAGQTARAARPPQIVSIQYLRALAALAVVAFHALEAGDSKFGVGAAGVDLFFVISGFIMWMLAQHGEDRPGRFLWRRFIRVAPLYWAATVLMVAVVLIAPNLMWAPPFTAADVLKSFAFVPYQDQWGHIHPVLTQGWTLNYEMFFYLVFAAVLPAPPRWRLGLLTAALGGLVTAGLLLGDAGAVAATYTNPLLAEFLAGVWLAHVWLKGGLRGRWAGWSLIAAGLGAFAVEQALGVREGPWRALYWGLPALAVVTGALMVEAAGGVRCWKLPKALGDSSYSTYLFHIFVITVLQRLLGGAPPAVMLVAALIGSAAAGYVLFLVLERPLTGALRKAPKLLAARAAPIRAPSLP